MVHLPPWPIINKYCYRNIWAARYKALQHHKADMGFLRDFLALLMSRRMHFCFEHTMYLRFAAVVVVVCRLLFTEATAAAFKCFIKSQFRANRGATRSQQMNGYTSSMTGQTIFY